MCSQLCLNFQETPSIDAPLAYLRDLQQLSEEVVAHITVLIDSHRYQEALNAASTADLGQNAPSSLILGLLRASRETRNQAFVHHIAKAVLKEMKPDVSVLLGLADTYAELGLSAEAEALFASIELLYPSNYRSYFDYAVFLQSAGLSKAAFDVIARGVEKCRGQVAEGEWSQLVAFLLCLTVSKSRADLRFGEQLGSRVTYAGRPIFKGLFVSMIKDEADILLDSLEGAYKAGFRNYLISDNMSADSSRVEIDAFRKRHKDCLVLLLTDPLESYFQADKINALWRFGLDFFKIAGRPIEWVFPFDGDEVIVQVTPECDLMTVLEQAEAANKKVLVGGWCTGSSRQVLQSRPAGVALEEIYPAVSPYDAVPIVKVAIRADPQHRLAAGSHSVDSCVDSAADVLNFNDFGLFMLHYPIRSVAQLRSKILNGVRALDAAPSLDKGLCFHWRQWYERFKREGDSFFERHVAEFVRGVCQRSFAAQDISDLIRSERTHDVSDAARLKMDLVRHAEKAERADAGLQGIHPHGYWEAGTAHQHIFHSPKLADWIVHWVKQVTNNDLKVFIYDFGCGLGDYLKRFQDEGYVNLVGFEGDPAERSNFADIAKQDLTEPFEVKQRGICLFLEVAEHIPEQLIGVALSNVINACDKYLILSWAIRGQPGFGHVHCLDNHEVISELEQRGFVLLEKASLDARMAADDFTPWFKDTIMIFERK